jgi:hypothetical protein
MAARRLTCVVKDGRLLAAVSAAQACATVALAWRPTLAAERVLGGLGAVMVAGYLSERLVRRRLIPSGWDTAETSIATAGMSLAAVMALLGLRSADAQAQLNRDAAPT